MQLVGSLYLLYFPYCGLILWEVCDVGNRQYLYNHTKLASLASLLLACSPPINGLLYGLKSQTLRRSVQNYWRKKATKSELQQVITRTWIFHPRAFCLKKDHLLCFSSSSSSSFLQCSKDDHNSNSGDPSANTERGGIEKTVRKRNRLFLPFPAVAAKAKRGAARVGILQNRKQLRQQ